MTRENVLRELQLHMLATRRTLIQVPIKSSLLNHIRMQRVPCGPSFLVVRVLVYRCCEARDLPVLRLLGEGVDRDGEGYCSEDDIELGLRLW
jgi:hypothetical protein